MSQDVQDILRALEEYERTVPESRGLELRLDLAEIVIRHLRQKCWTQRDLARRTSMKESFISRLVHSNANCTLDTAGRLLFALGVNARLAEVASTTVSPTVMGTTGERRRLRIAPEEVSDAQSVPQSQECTQQPPWKVKEGASEAVAVG